MNNQEIKKQFLLEENVTYLNTSNMSPLLRSVQKAGLSTLERRASPWTLTTKDWFGDSEMLRDKVAGVFDCASDDVSLIPSASYGLAIAAKNLKIKKGKSILILKDQFPSNYYVWHEIAKQQRLQLITVNKIPGESLTESVLKQIGSSTGIVALPNCHWITGDFIDLHIISDAVKSIGAYLVLDLSQSFGVMPVAIRKIDPDFAVSVGYKWMLGPYGVGYLYVATRWQQEGQPLEYSWYSRQGSDDFSRLTLYTDKYQKGARRFDMGESSLLHTAPMAIAAIDWIQKIGVNRIYAAIEEITRPLIEYKKSHSLNHKYYGVHHIISIPIAGKEEKIKQRLVDNKVIVSFRGDSIRVSAHLFNTPEDIEKLLSCIS